MVNPNRTIALFTDHLPEYLPILQPAMHAAIADRQWTIQQSQEAVASIYLRHAGQDDQRMWTEDTRSSGKLSLFLIDEGRTGVADEVRVSTEPPGLADIRVVHGGAATQLKKPIVEAVTTFLRAIEVSTAQTEAETTKQIERLLELLGRAEESIERLLSKVHDRDGQIKRLQEQIRSLRRTLHAEQGRGRKWVLGAIAACVVAVLTGVSEGITTSAWDDYRSGGNDAAVCELEQFAEEIADALDD